MMLKRIAALALSTLLIGASATVKADDLTGMQSMVSGYVGMTQGQCMQIAEKVCGQVFGSCQKATTDSYYGTNESVHLQYTCIALPRARLMVMVTSGASASPANGGDLEATMKNSYRISAPYFE